LIFQERKITKYSQTFPNKMQIKIECFLGLEKQCLQYAEALACKINNNLICGV